MGWPRGADTSIRSGSVQHGRLLAVVGLLTVSTLVTFDCLNLLQSDTWTDLSRAPHLAAVSQGEAEAVSLPARS